MDWKTFYRDELLSPEGQEYIEHCFDRLPETDAPVENVIRRDGVLSFPHTSLTYSVEPISRVVAGLYRSGVKNVVALGVLHCNSLPAAFSDPYQEYVRLADRPGSRDPRLEELFSRFSGGFLLPGPLSTAFGEVPRCEVADSPRGLLRTDPELISREFSLDTFLALIAFHARKHGVDTLPVCPVYVGLTRDPDGSFRTASALAAWLADCAGPQTAVVSTGDLVHYGNAYSAWSEMEKLPPDQRSLTEHFRNQVEEVLDLAFRDRDYEQFHQAAGLRLKADHRNLLPVVVEYLGSRASYELLDFSLSDYSPILGVAPPCLVASVLAAFLPRQLPTPDGEYESADQTFASG
jgi:predicted class III extradiol MEMO1 family dioxygenase